MSRKEEYYKYLKSDEWKLLRATALDRSDGFCQFCGQPATQVHHVKYPKKYGDENPDNLIPVCKKCHEVSHGIQEKDEMSNLKNAEIMKDISPTGIKMNYLLSDGRVYASAQSWSKALQVPLPLKDWFESGLARVAMLKKHPVGGPLERTYLGRTVYRWPAVIKQLRVFDRLWHNGGYDSYTKGGKSLIDEFHENYEKLVDWGDELQEKAIENALNPTDNEPATIEHLKSVMKSVTKPVFAKYNDRIHDQDAIITSLDDRVSNIENLVPSNLDSNEFISIRKAILELNLDSEEMPLFPQSKENLSGLAGQFLVNKGALKGDSVSSRIDGKKLITAVNTYCRGDIYLVLDQIKSFKQKQLDLES